MANVLDNLAPDIYVAADQIGRELVGAIPSITINAGSEGAAIGDTVRSHYTTQPEVVSPTPAMEAPTAPDATVGTKTMTITNDKAVRFQLTGEETKHLDNGVGFSTIYGEQIKQALRTLTNLIEVDVLTSAYQGASRMVGTAGTTPFASNLDVIAEARQILADNGVPVNDGNISLIINTLAGTNLRNLAQLQGVNTSGSDRLLRQGELLNLQGASIKESAGIQYHTKGTGSGYLASAAAAIGDTTFSLDTGTGTILAGDAVTFAGDSNVYSVNTALTGGDLVIGDTGLVEAVADTTALTVGNDYTANVFLHKSAMELAIRAPAMPSGGDKATDRMVVQDPHSGLSFAVSFYDGYRMKMIEVAAVWGQKVWNSDGIALVRG